MEIVSAEATGPCAVSTCVICHLKLCMAIYLLSMVCAAISSGVVNNLSSTGSIEPITAAALPAPVITAGAAGAAAHPLSSNAPAKKYAITVFMLIENYCEVISTRSSLPSDNPLAPRAFQLLLPDCCCSLSYTPPKNLAIHSTRPDFESL